MLKVRIWNKLVQVPTFSCLASPGSRKVKFSGTNTSRHYRILAEAVVMMLMMEEEGGCRYSVHGKTALHVLAESRVCCELPRLHLLHPPCLAVCPSCLSAPRVTSL